MQPDIITKHGVARTFQNVRVRRDDSHENVMVGHRG